jgi:hypothetical protein
MRIRFQHCIWMLIRIDGAKPMRIHPDPDPGQTVKSQVEFLHERGRKAGDQVYLLILFSFHAPGSGSGSRPAKSKRIRIQKTDF